MRDRFATGELLRLRNGLQGTGDAAYGFVDCILLYGTKLAALRLYVLFCNLFCLLLDHGCYAPDLSDFGFGGIVNFGL